MCTSARNAHQLRDFLAQLLDVLALLADHDARTGGVDRDARLLGRTLDQDLEMTDACASFLRRISRTLMVVLEVVGECSACSRTTSSSSPW